MGRTRSCRTPACTERTSPRQPANGPVEDRILVFGYSEKVGMYDEQAGSVCNQMGEAVSGRLAGTQLVYLTRKFFETI